MRTFVLLYHDVLDGGAPDSTGLSGPGAAVYKLDLPVFRRHLDAIASRVAAPPALIGAGETANGAWSLTFDDGGCTALRPTADVLDERGWKGHFFVTAGRVGETAFLDDEGVRELARRGHAIGSHSWSHPPRISALSPAELRDEWRRSVERLEDVLGSRVDTASVPGGYFSGAVADAAAEAGIRWLFTSEPQVRSGRRGELTLIGRFSVIRSTPADTAASLAAGELRPRLQQWLWWNAKKAAKSFAGGAYARLRTAVLSRDFDSGSPRGGASLR